ncbi:MAG: hypothetical protein U1D30_10390 [Planctomycetota bacterium]
MNKPSFLVRPGDVITVVQVKLQGVYQAIIDGLKADPIPWVNFEADALRATVTGYPGKTDISLPVEIGLVIEFMSR